MRKKTNRSTPSSREIRQELTSCLPQVISTRQAKVLVGSAKLWAELHRRRLLWPTLPSRGEGVAALYSVEAIRTALAALHAANQPMDPSKNRKTEAA